MKEFVVSADNYKAVLKIDGQEYKFKSPTAGELKSFNEKAKALVGKESESFGLMEEMLCYLGSMKKEALEKLPVDTFMSLFKHLVTPNGDEGSKKS